MKNQLGNIFKPAISLCLICLIVTAALAFTNSITMDTIEERAQVDAENSRKEVLADAQTFEKIKGVEEISKDKPELQLVREAYKGLKEGSVIGYVFTVVSKGYGGDIEIMVGINLEGTINGVKISKHNETPGLGSKASKDKFRSQLESFRPEQPLKVVKSGKTKQEEIEAISGATITSKAVVKAVQCAVDMAAELEKRGKAK